MKIESYSFGRITINGKTYTSDVIIYPDRVQSSWWRQEGHQLRVADLSAVLDEEPEVLIVGTGYSGLMKMTPETADELSKRNIEVYAERTSRAVERFNGRTDRKKVIAALHLTC